MNERPERLEHRFFRPDPIKFSEFEEDFHFLSTEITARARGLKHSLGCNVVVTFSNQAISLAEEAAIRSWYQGLVRRSEAEMMQVLRREFGSGPPRHTTFAQFLESDWAGDPETLQRSAQLRAWNKAKGTLFEWAILAALLTGHMTGAGQAHSEIRMGAREPSQPIYLQGRTRYLWYQKRIIGQRSGLDTRPDLLITSDRYEPREDSILGFIECKCTATLSSRIIREVFGTAYDVSSSFAAIASYELVPDERRRSAAGLGLSVLVNPLKRLQRKGYLDRKVGFFETIRSEIEELDQEKPFLKRETDRRTWVDRKVR